MNNSDEVYRYTYILKKTNITKTTTKSNVIIEMDQGTIPTIQFCNKCGCSKKVKAVPYVLPSFVKASSLFDQIAKWNKKNDERSK